MYNYIAARTFDDILVCAINYDIVIAYLCQFLSLTLKNTMQCHVVLLYAPYSFIYYTCVIYISVRAATSPKEEAWRSVTRQSVIFHSHITTTLICTYHAIVSCSSSTITLSEVCQEGDYTLTVLYLSYKYSWSIKIMKSSSPPPSFLFSQEKLQCTSKQRYT